MPCRLRAIAAPFVVAPPAGTRIRTRLRIAAADQAVLRQVGEHLGRLAGLDLAERCRLGLGEVDRVRRKRQLTAASSSRWAGALTRTSEDQWQRAHRNLLATGPASIEPSAVLGCAWPPRPAADPDVRAAMPAASSGGRSSDANNSSQPGSRAWRPASRTAGSVSSGVAGACCTLATTSTANWPRPSGEDGGGQPAGFSPPTARWSIRSATGRSRWTPSRAGAS